MWAKSGDERMINLTYYADITVESMTEGPTETVYFVYASGRPEQLDGAWIFESTSREECVSYLSALFAALNAQIPASMLEEIKLQKDALSASEALTGFCTWLLQLEEPIQITGQRDAGVMAQLIHAFVSANQLTDPQDGWQDHLVYPTSIRVESP